MINAEITTGDGCFMAVIKGHAGYAPKGYDIVCAGVSALTMALLEAVTTLLNREDASYFSVEANDGAFEMRVFGIKSSEAFKCINNLFIMFVKGIERIEADYPDYLKFTMFEFPFKGDDNDTSEQTMNLH